MQLLMHKSGDGFLVAAPNARKGLIHIQAAQPGAAGSKAKGCQRGQQPVCRAAYTVQRAQRQPKFVMKRRAVQIQHKPDAPAPHRRRQRLLVGRIGRKVGIGSRLPAGADGVCAGAFSQQHRQRGSKIFFIFQLAPASVRRAMRRRNQQRSTPRMVAKIGLTLRGGGFIVGRGFQFQQPR